MRALSLSFVVRTTCWSYLDRRLCTRLAWLRVRFCTAAPMSHTPWAASCTRLHSERPRRGAPSVQQTVERMKKLLMATRQHSHLNDYLIHTQ